MFFGAGFNFIFALILLFLIALIFGSQTTKPLINEVKLDYPFYNVGIKQGDVITKINNEIVKTQDEVLLKLEVYKGENISVEVLRDNDKYTYQVTPKAEDETYYYGFVFDATKKYGISNAFKYMINKTATIIKTLNQTLYYLFSGKVKIKQLSGPVGIYSVVGTVSKEGIANIFYLMALLSINVGYINLIPFPAFDGGRILFLIIEKIRRKPLSDKVENLIHNIGFYILILLMLFVTFNDIVKVIK